MCINMPVKEDDPHKWNRWLGFIQGQLVALNLTSIRACKEENKSSLKSAFNYSRSIIDEELKRIHGLDDKSPDFMAQKQID